MGKKVTLSLAQQRLFFVEQAFLEKPLFNILLILSLEGKIEIQLLQKAFIDLLKRHEVLRLRIQQVNGELEGFIADFDSYPLNIVHYTEIKKEFANVLDFIKIKAAKKFDLLSDKLFTAYFIVDELNKYFLVMILHHIITDEWSNNILLHDLSMFYQSHKENNIPNIPSISLSYSEYVLKQNRLLHEGFFDTRIEYWVRNLQSAPRILALPTDKPRPKELTYLGGTVSVLLPIATLLAVKEYAISKRVTLFGVLLTVFKCLLYRYSGENSIIVGYPSANRTIPEIENIVGLFVNVIPIFTQLKDDQTFEELLHQIRINLIEGYENQDFPFDQLVNRLGSSREQNYHPIFQVLFTLHGEYGYEEIFPELNKEFLELDGIISKFDLSLFCREAKDGLHITFNYSQDLFHESTMRVLAKVYNNMIIAILENDKVLIKDIPLITEQEKHQQLVELNKKIARYTYQELRMHSLFKVRATLNPDNIALILDNKEYTYKLVDDLSDKIARYLSKIEMKPASIVAISLEPGLHLVVSILGILKAGFTYLPIDLDYPTARINHMLQDSQAVILITKTASLNKFNHFKGKIINLETDWDKFLDEENSCIEINNNEIACIIYTSGSTGNPKGVLYKHTSICNRAIWLYREYPFTQDEVCIALSSISFVDFITEVFLPLLSGLKVVIADIHTARDPNLLITYLSKYRVTRVSLVPSLLRELLNKYINLSLLLPNLKHWEISGETFPTNLIYKTLTSLRDIRLINRYGSTEATSIIYNELTLSDQEQISIESKIIANTEVYILDKGLHLLPHGLIGEICVSGAALAKGYLNDSRLTNSKFIQNPFSLNKEDVIYKTGDLGCFSVNGRITIIGRNDSQIKINGYRIELGEIQSTLEKHHAVKQSVIICQKHDDQNQIVAYLTYKDYYHDLDNELYIYLKKYLPEYMLPTKLIVLKEFPINMHGKIDYQLLQNADRFNSLTTNEYIQPRNHSEKKLSEIWQQVLNKEKIGIHDNFFRIGGNSLIAIRLIAKIQDEFHTNFPIAYIYQYPTIATSVAQLTYSTEAIESVLIDNSNVTKIEEQVLSFAQERLWFIEQYEGGTNAYNVSMIFKLISNTNQDILANSIKSLVERHEPLRTLIKKDHEGNFYQLVCSEQEYLLNKRVVSNQKELDQELNKDIGHIYDLTNEYPIRVCFYQLQSIDNTVNYLSIVIHHIAFDGWSVDIFLKELQAYYTYHNKQSQGIESSLDLPALSIQYKDFAVWQRNYLTGEILNKQLEYWKNKLNGYETLKLITDKLRPLAVNYTGNDIYFEIDEVVSKCLRELAQEFKVSLYSLLLAGYCLMLRLYTNQDDIIVGTPVANRHYSQVKNLIGFFVNSLVLRIQINPKDTIKDFVQTVGKEAIEAQLHQDLPFEKLVEELRVGKDSSRNPVFQVVFGVQSFGSQFYNPSGDQASVELAMILERYIPQDNSYNIARFDISTFIDDHQSKLRGKFNYAVSLYNQETITSFINTYVEILTQLAKLTHSGNKLEQAKLSDLDYLNKEELNKICVEWNQTDQEYNIDITIHQLFEAQVQRTPDNVAIISNGIEITYKELNQKANQLANYITKDVGLEPDDLVVLCLDRGEHMLIAMLGVLKAGGAYVAIDPSYPDERIGYILEDTKAKLVCTNQKYQERLKNIMQIASMRLSKLLSIDDNSFQKKVLSRFKVDINIKPKIKSNNLAYIIYTSGTTGYPKGVMVEHGGVVNYILNFQNRVGISCEEKVDLSSSLAFDFTISTTLCSLCSGGQIIVYTDKLEDLTSYRQHLIKNAVSIAKLTPSYFELLIDTLEHTQISKVVLGGEKIGINILNKLSTLTNAIKIYDEYGPTETTVGAYCIQIHPHCSAHTTNTYDNYKLYVLDSNLNILPVRAVGELYISGIGLARGYLNQPELTKKQFIKNPFQNTEDKKQGKNARLYKTGDLCRWLPEGNIEYVGRNDSQIKLNGYRIELDEIEAILAKHNDIKQVVVVVKQLSNSTISKIIAYFVPGEFVPTSTELQEFLSTKLPEYMLPSAYLRLEKIPLTFNGKLDKAALPDPVVVENNYTPPQNKTESIICQIWAEVLGINQSIIGIEISFFDLGGNSLTTIKLVSYLNKAFTIGLSIKDIFLYPTISQISRVIEKTLKE
jgi:amino acid adenylation domain-containing protein